MKVTTAMLMESQMRAGRHAHSLLDGNKAGKSISLTVIRAGKRQTAPTRSVSARERRRESTPGI